MIKKIIKMKITKIKEIKKEVEQNFFMEGILYLIMFYHFKKKCDTHLYLLS